MPATQPKWKMVSFRLSTEEYAESQQLCRASGYNSMSRFALCAMRSFVPVESHSPTGSNGHFTEINALSRRLDELSAEIKRLAQKFQN